MKYYRVPPGLILGKEPILLGTYLASMRYATICNEVSGSIALYMEFLGYKPEKIHGNKYVAQEISEALKELTKMDYVRCPLKPRATYTLNQHFEFPFGRLRGWRSRPSSLDAVFTFGEIEHALCLNKNRNFIKEHKIDLGDILHVSAFLRTQADTDAFNVFRKDRYSRVTALNYDDVASALNLTPDRLLHVLDCMRKLELGTSRVLTMKPKTRAPYTRFLIYARHGRENNSQITRAVKHLKALYSDCNFDDNWDTLREKRGVIKPKRGRPRKDTQVSKDGEANNGAE